ncbi:GIY-YIG nuclease family protein [Roseovarius sp. ZX-A-9]|uniref:GIY-YIG nuclease family protein n=1 Tax=Roseovarius sp. ZX-A-9 TaxID=3014783 RepID=UPI00232E1F6F|nr:GIY-YIG nuclease family protein [Roseovarius sp. ZX-A-9]
MLTLSSILEITDFDDYKVHAARWNGEHQPLDVLAEDPEGWIGWNSWRNAKNEFNREFIISLAAFYPERETWLFGGIFRVIKRNEIGDRGYKIEPVDKGSALIGRLKLTGAVSRGRSFLLSNINERLTVSEVLKEPYGGLAFPGYGDVSHDFARLEAIWHNERADWKTALRHVKGVYVIADKATGKKYVGSAYGETGIWSRWGQYMTTGHGWNRDMIGLVADAGKDYARANFRMTLLESWPFQTDDATIIAREGHWKEALLTRGVHGYNAN